MKQKKILIAPLDWGLGHATRCIPIIRELKRLNCRIIIASEGSQAALLREEFPNATHIELSGYHIRYAKSPERFGIKMLTQLPKIQRAVRQEHLWLRKIVKEYQPDAIISDNRFGLYHKKIPCILITHQLRIISPLRGLGEDLLQKINYHYIKKFDACWVMDFESKENNMAGKLSHPRRHPPFPVKYLGALSRFERDENLQEAYDLLVLISGPEPQRSKFEELICKQITGLPIKAIIVCGQPDNPKEIQLTSTIKIVNHLDSLSLQKAIQQSRMVLSRSGYTTVMDIIKLHKKAVFIPTPGQTEQEYLAKTLQEKGLFPSFSQNDFKLKKVLEAATNFSFQRFSFPESDNYKKVIRDFIRECS